MRSRRKLIIEKGSGGEGEGDERLEAAEAGKERDSESECEGELTQMGGLSAQGHVSFPWV